MAGEAFLVQVRKIHELPKKAGVTPGFFLWPDQSWIRFMLFRVLISSSLESAPSWR
jgi:hypothetical protein